jgi:hypothetical protein
MIITFPAVSTARFVESARDARRRNGLGLASIGIPTPHMAQKKGTLVDALVVRNASVVVATDGRYRARTCAVLDHLRMWAMAMGGRRHGDDDREQCFVDLPKR